MRTICEGQRRDRDLRAGVTPDVDQPRVVETGCAARRFLGDQFGKFACFRSVGATDPPRRLRRDEPGGQAHLAGAVDVSRENWRDFIDYILEMFAAVDTRLGASQSSVGHGVVQNPASRAPLPSRPHGGRAARLLGHGALGSPLLAQ